MPHLLRALLQILLSLGLGLFLTGCMLRAMFGNVVVTEDLSEDINLIIDSVLAEATVAACFQASAPPFGPTSTCTYIIDGEIVTSTVSLLSEFGLAGVLIDPVIAQIPAGVHTLTATYDVGSGPQPLTPTPVTSFKVTHNLSVTAEPGHQFVILELPASVEALVPTGVPTDGLPISYTLDYAQSLPLHEPVPPQTIKLMLTGRVTLNGHKYYVPLLPCVTEFAQVPALTLPESVTPQSLMPALGALTPQPCQGQVYFFNPEPPIFDSRLYMPLVRR